jgi:hypothetical protein
MIQQEDENLKKLKHVEIENSKLKDTRRKLRSELVSCDKIFVILNEVIQVDIGGHPPIPLEPPPLLLSVFQFLHSLLFLAVFSGPELPGPF